MVEDAELARIREQKRLELESRLGAQPPTGPVPLTDATFADFVAQHPLVLIDFWAPWCGPCRVVGPLVEEIAREYSGRVSVGKVDTDSCPVTAGRFGITAIPTLAVFRDGTLVDGVMGAAPKARLTSLVERWLAAPRTDA
jgi:thioredoxin 1